MSGFQRIISLMSSGTFKEWSDPDHKKATQPIKTPIGKRPQPYLNAVRSIVILYGLLFMASPALAQWQVPDHAVPVGRGAGVTGFKSATPGLTGTSLVSGGASSDPTFKNVGTRTIVPDCDTTGSVDCTTLTQSAVTTLEAEKGGTVALPCGLIKLNGVTISYGGITIQGCSWEDYASISPTNPGPDPFPPAIGTHGTYVLTTDSTKSAFTFACALKHATIQNMAFTQTQPADTIGWTPTVYPPTLDNIGCGAGQASTGSFVAQNILFRGIYWGIRLGNYTSANSYVGRTNLRNIYGTFFATGIAFNALSDVAVVDHVHFWPVFYAGSGNANVYGYIQDNAVAFFMARVDNPQFSNIFVNGMFKGFVFNDTGGGATANCQMTNIGLDGINFGISVEAGAHNCTISNLYHQSPGAAPPYPVGGSYLRTTGTASFDSYQTNVRLANYNTAAVSLQGVGTEISFTNLRVDNWNAAASGAAAIDAAATNTVTVTGDYTAVNGGAGTRTSGAGTFLGLAAGVSGSIPYFISTGVESASPLLTQYGVIYGGGAGAPPVAAAAMTNGQLLVGQTGAAPLPKSITGCAVTAAGAMSCPASAITSGAALTKTDDTNVTLALGGSPSSALLAVSSITVGWTGQLAVSRGGTGIGSGTSGGIPYFSGSTTIASSAVLAANQIVLGGGAGVAPATLGSLGTTTTLLHGNAAGAPTFGAVVSADMNITTTSCTNQFVTAISAGGVGTCTTDTLAGAQHANQGTTTTVLHGNASGNPSWAAVSLTADVSGILPFANGGVTQSTSTYTPTVGSQAGAGMTGTATGRYAKITPKTVWLDVLITITAVGTGTYPTITLPGGLSAATNGNKYVLIAKNTSAGTLWSTTMDSGNSSVALARYDNSGTVLVNDVLAVTGTYEID